jgi:hypothetical protein
MPVARGCKIAPKKPPFCNICFRAVSDVFFNAKRLSDCLCRIRVVNCGWFRGTLPLNRFFYTFAYAVNEIFTAHFYAAQSPEFGVCVHNTLTHRGPFASRRQMNAYTVRRRVLFTSARTCTVLYHRRKC